MAAIETATGSPYAAVLGIGSYRPSRIVPNADIVDAIDSSDEWIQQRSGIKQRRFATPEETVQMMSVAAARKAIEPRPSTSRRRVRASATGSPWPTRWCAAAAPATCW